MRNKSVQGIVIGSAAFLAGLLLWLSGALQPIEGIAWDWRVRVLHRPEQASPRVAQIFLDQSSLEWARDAMSLPWPWPREVYTALIDFCRRGGAEAIVFDVVFTEPSYMGVSDDRLLGAAIARTPSFVGTVFLGSETGAATNWPSTYRYQGMDIAGADTLRRSPAGPALTATRASFSIPEIATNCPVVGNVGIPSGTDPTIRRAPLFAFFDGKAIPSLALAAYRVAHPETELRMEGRTLWIGDTAAPLDARGRVIPRFRGPTQTHRTVSAAAVIESELMLRENNTPSLDPGMFKDAFVFFGFTATALLDLKPTPLSGVTPGVEIHATILDNLLRGDLIRDPPRWAVAGIVLLLALATGIALRHGSSGWQTAGIAVIALGIAPAAAFAAYPAGFWLPLAFPATGLGLSLVGGITVNYLVEGRQKRYIKSAFKQYLSPAVIEKLLRDPDSLSLGGETRELSIFFSDIQGFTSISEQLDPQQLTSLLNDYLTAMTDIVLDEGGTIDKYEGDAIIAFWNAPLDIADHAVRCVRAALRCQARLDELRPGFRERVGRDVRARIGINTGPVVVGNMGSNQRFDYTFLGDAGNLASRLEGVNKQFGTFLLISESTRDSLAGAFPAREISRVSVVGRTEPVRIFEPLSEARSEAMKDMLEPFGAALELFYRGEFEAARRGFEALSDRDAAAAAYVQRCATLRDHPPETWSGVWTLTEK